MDLTSHPEISGSTVLHIYDVQRGTGSPVQPTSMWCVVCVVLLGIEPSQVEHSWLASCSYGSTHLQYIPYIGWSDSSIRGPRCHAGWHVLRCTRSCTRCSAPRHMSQRAHMYVPVVLHSHGGLTGGPLAYGTYRTCRHLRELWTTSWIHGPISCLSSWGDVLILSLILRSRRCGTTHLRRVAGYW